MQQPMQIPKDISDPTTAIDMALVLMAKAFTLNDTTPTNNNQRSSSNPSNMQIAQPGMNMDQDRQMLMVEDNVGNQFRPNAMQNVRNQAEANGNGINGNQIRCYNCQGVDHYTSNCTVKPRKRDAVYLQKQMQIAQKEEAGIQLTQEEFNFMADAGSCEEIERVNANCTLKDNLQQASTSGTHTDKAPVYDSDGSTEQYTELLEPIPEPHQVQQNDSNVISEVSSVEQDRGIVEQHPATVEKTHAYFESLYNNWAIKAEKVNTINRKLRETNADLTTELARYKNQEKCFEISQEKYDNLERCYQKSVYQEQCLTKKINALHLSSGKQITTLNEKITNLNNHLSKEKSTVSSIQEEKKKLKSDFKIHEDELLDKQIQLDNKIKELDNILLRAQLFDKVSEQKDINKVPPKVVESNDLSNPVTLNSVPTTKESKVVENDKVIAPGMFRINLFKTSREHKVVPFNKVRASVRRNPIIVSQPLVITKKDVNSKTNGFSSKDVKNTTRTRRPQPRNKPKHDKVPSKSKSSCLSNKLEKIEENHRSLQSSTNQKHTSSACNNIKLAVRNEKSEVVCNILKRASGHGKTEHVLTAQSVRQYTKSPIHLVKNLKVCSWAKLVRILISEGSLSLLNILGTKSLAEMYTMLVMKDKLKFCAALTGLRDTLYRKSPSHAFGWCSVFCMFGGTERCDNHDLSRFDNQSIERDRLIGIGFVLDFVEFISFTFSDKEMILVIEAVLR
ncbi:hypothetical protein Tco_1007783 [Tanacetum coccineum]